MEKIILLMIEKVERDIVSAETNEGSFVELPISFFPPNLSEGHIYEVSIRRNLTEEKNRRKTIRNLQKKLTEES